MRQIFTSESVTNATKTKYDMHYLQLFLKYVFDVRLVEVLQD